ncbi:MAG: carbamoyltransferase [Lysobacterales bacterium CG02_land_8_20_14_3_00_62_12]|nr:MAG: carbamoyltransferase [Xanthomonadales bacterium CG02_land_8_20_14_3_00_62_12]
MIVLGLNAFHADAAAALVIDGQVIAAAEEERFCRIKHWAGFPAQATAYCLQAAGITLADVDHLAVNTDPRAAWGRRLWQVVRRPPTLASMVDRLRNRTRRHHALDALRQAFPEAPLRAELHHVPHHLAHLASAYFASPWDAAVAVSVDGAGDFATGAWGIGRGAHLQINQQVWFPHSLGIFYQAMTQYLGFPHYGDEYKVMGLAPYGEPLHVAAIRQLVRLDAGGGYRLDTRYFRHERERIAFQWEQGVPTFDTLYAPSLLALLGPARHPDEALSQRHKDIARSVQAVFEECYLGWLDQLQKRSGLRRLALAGGCAQNSVANGKILSHTGFTEVYVAAAGYDAGGALGAALQVASQLGAPRCQPLLHAQLGPAFSVSAIGELLAAESARIVAAGCRVQWFADAAAVDERVVDCIVAGGVVGWFQGRMEWGPRALGQRSILADPRRADIKEILNAKIKRRESFRPFAPSVMREAVADWFEQDAEVPFMGQVFPIRAEKRALIPAVTHVDGSGRLQTVTREHCPRYHALIAAFARRTGVPMLLNTSFNENEPIVCRPIEALNCFLRTRMDLLVLGEHLLWRVAG